MGPRVARRVQESLDSKLGSMRFEFFIAARYLRAKRRQAVVGVITAISVIGVAAGVASLIIALAITNGMRRDLQERLVGSTSHVDLMRVAGDGIRDWRPLLERLRQVPHVAAAAPGLYGQVLISHGARSGGGLIKGVIPADEKTVGDLLQSVREGSAAALEPEATNADSLHPTLRGGTAKDGAPGHSGLGRETSHFSAIKPREGADGVPGSVAARAVPPIVIGKDLAETIGVKVGDSVLVTSPQGELTPLGLVPRYQRFQVAGIFKSGFYQYDSSYAFVRLRDAQKLFSEPDLISVISFKVDDL
jgi:lipoprotein-releasing system permease protein